MCLRAVKTQLLADLAIYLANKVVHACRGWLRCLARASRISTASASSLHWVSLSQQQADEYSTDEWIFDSVDFQIIAQIRRKAVGPLRLHTTARLPYIFVIIIWADLL